MNPALISYYYSGSGGETYSSELQAWIDKLDSLGYTKPNATFLNALDVLLATSLETGTVLSRMKTGNIYGFGSIEAGTVNIKDPNSYQHTLVNSPTFLAGSGVKSNSTTSYINTKYKVNEYAGIETDVTVCINITESSTDISASRQVFGARSQAASSSTPHRLSPLLTSSTGQRNGYGANDNFTNADHQGRYILTYNGTQSVLYKNYDGLGGGIKDTQIVTPVTPDLSNDELFLAQNTSGTSGGLTAAGFYDKYTMWLFRFNRFSDADATAWKTAGDTFLTSVA